MANYDIRTLHERHQTEYYLVEAKTKYIINIFKNPKEAFNACKVLNRGSGFNGETPPFVARHPQTGILALWPN